MCTIFVRQEHTLECTIPVREPLPPQYFVRVTSDRWVGCHTVLPISFQHLILPGIYDDDNACFAIFMLPVLLDQYPPHTNLLNCTPLPVTALKNPLFESLYSRFSHFNPIQTQLFHVLYHTDKNVLVRVFLLF